MSTAELTTICALCESPLDAEETQNPRRDYADKAICDDCYRAHYTFPCHGCGEDEDNEHKGAVGELWAVFKPVPAVAPKDPALWYDARTREMRPGIYRVTEWPVYWSDMFDGGLYADAFERVCDLPEEMKDGGYQDYPCGPLCRECRVTIEAEERKKL